MARYVADLETDALLKQATVIHCLAIRDIDSGEVQSFTHRGMGGYPDILLGLGILSDAELVVFHNGHMFDVPIIEHFYPNWKHPKRILDTLILSRLMFPNLKNTDLRLVKEGKITREVMGSHSLKAWGQRLGDYKASFNGPWDTWSHAMHDYMIQDTKTGLAVWQHMEKAFKAKRTTRMAIELEHAASALCAKIERNGFPFDEQSAKTFYAGLEVQSKEQEQKLQDALGIIWTKVPSGSVTPKKDNVKKGYTAGAPLTRVTWQPINPTSHKQLIRVLQTRYGWVPKDYTDAGQPKLDDEIIETVPLPEDLKQLLRDYLTLNKIKSFLISKRGDSGWIMETKSGRIHAEYNVQGAVTGRATHSRPNISQVPSVDSPYGSECRSLFVPVPGWVLVGCDLSSLELRMLANMLHPIDGGAYTKAVLEGDVHITNQRAAGLSTRAEAKRFI